MKLNNVVRENRRLAILRFLLEDPIYQMNTSLMQSSLCEIGISCSRDQVETDCAWLEEQDLVEVHDLGNVKVIHLLERGQEAAEGKIKIPGVKRPRAGR